MLNALNRCRTTLLPTLLLALAACQSPTAGDQHAMDIHSFAQPALVRVSHLDLDLTLDFDAECVHGTVVVWLARKDESAPLILDAQGLDIESVESEDGSARPFVLGDAGPFGSALTVTLQPKDERVRIRYRSGRDAAALQWLAAEQTDAGRGRFLYTQGQAILTRSWIPLQDTPGVRATYTARIHAPAEMTVVMAAESLGRDADGTWRFEMQQPIPSYLIALACGTLEQRAIGSRCGVWAEPSLIDRAAAELEDVGDMVRVCETLFGPYRWGRFDVLILPPAFPFGGMENPRLTFATPTILAGDKSLVALIAHELAHSWSGNLVTNATWSDFWLNEGFTVYLEQRIMEALYGKARADMEILLGLQDLEAELAKLPPADQVLHIDLRGRNPDDGMTSVPYDKGAAFLRHLEQHFGRDRFGRFLNTYFTAHAFQSITTADFLAYLRAELFGGDAALWQQLEVDTWVYEPGLPASTPRPQSAAFASVDAVRQDWLQGRPATALRTDDWSTHQWLHFLRHMPSDVGRAGLAELDGRYHFTDTGNSEILAAWLELAIQQGYEPAYSRLETFLGTVGRRKFLKPLYEALAATPAGLLRARRIYQQARPRYHAVSRRTLDAILNW